LKNAAEMPPGRRLQHAIAADLCVGG